MNGRRRTFLGLLGDPSVGRVVVEHRDWFCWFGSGYVQAALGARGGELVAADSTEVDDDLVWDVTEILTSMCARRYGKRAAAKRAVAAVADAADHQAA